MLDSRLEPLADAEATLAFGRRVGARLKPGDVVLLFGGLGAGKTTFSRGAVAGFTGCEQEVPSPTYTLVQTYEGPAGALWHLDLYRLKSPEEAFELGLEDAWAEAVCLIEWPERLGAYLPADRLEIHFEIDGEGRRAVLTGRGAWRERVGSL